MVIGSVSLLHLWYKINDMKKFNIKNLKPWVTQLSEDFMDDYIENEDDRETFINQVVDYGENTCSTEQEVLCFVDGLLTKFPK